MAEKTRVCTCEKCGNESEMLISCQWVDKEESPGHVVKVQQETLTCAHCGNEADMIISPE